MSDSCDPMNCSLSGSSVHGILQARILEWVAQRQEVNKCYWKNSINKLDRCKVATNLQFVKEKKISICEVQLKAQWNEVCLYLLDYLEFTNKI